MRIRAIPTLPVPIIPSWGAERQSCLRRSTFLENLVMVFSFNVESLNEMYVEYNR
jgi:hypothetical protein